MMALVITSTAFAQDAKLRRLDTGVDANVWEAVGRLDIEGSGFCTGSLVAPNMVLTAAHCLFDKETGEQIDHETIEFLAGWRNGRASAYRNVRRAAIHPDYSYQGELDSGDVRYDLALLELTQPIRNGRVKPFTTGAHPPVGASVGVVSYAKDRSEAPSLQEVCNVVGFQDGVLVTSCDVDFGASGAPIFVFEEGQAQIVSVVSAKAEMNGESVSLGTSLGNPLDELRLVMDQSRGFLGNLGDTIRRVGLGTSHSESDAKFVKP